VHYFHILSLVQSYFRIKEVRSLFHAWKHHCRHVSLLNPTSGPNRRGHIVRDFLSVADVLEEPQLARLYAYFAREGEATVQEVIDVLEFAQGTTYGFVNQLVAAGVVKVTRDE